MNRTERPYKGWQCPRCKQINAPWVPYCDCEEQEQTKSNTITWGAPTYTWDTITNARYPYTVTTNATDATYTTIDATLKNNTTASGKANDIHYTMTSLNQGDK